MADSDVDSWYDWRREDDVNDIHGKSYGAHRNIRLSSDSLQNLTSDDSRRASSRSNSMFRYGPVPTSARSRTEVRFINPAIYAETLNDDESAHDVEIRVKVNSKPDGQVLVNCGDSAKMTGMMSALSIENDLAVSYVNHAGDQGSTQETYRCYSSDTPSIGGSVPPSVMHSKSVTSCRLPGQGERRCRINTMSENKDGMCSARQMDSDTERYMFNGHRMARMSSSSLSSIRISENRPDELELAKKLSYNEWMRKKQDAARLKKEKEDEAERKKQLEIERQAREKEERETRERENFLKWSEKKKTEEEKKKAVVEKELELQKQLKEIQDKAAVAKTLCLRQWERNKVNAEKVRQKKEELKQKQQEEEKKKRLEESTKAYENWRKTAKNKPKPATQGLLPHQMAKPAYVNPTPWQTIVDDNEDAEGATPNVGKKPQVQSRINSRRSVTSYY